jgi:hypothetical protein
MFSVMVFPFLIVLSVQCHGDEIVKRYGVIIAHLLGFGDDDGLVTEKLSQAILRIRAIAAPGNNPFIACQLAASLIETHTSAERKVHRPTDRLPAYDVGGVHFSSFRLILPFLVFGASVAEPYSIAHRDA